MARPRAISATSCSLWTPRVIDAQADVHVDVPEHLGQVPGVAVERVGVQEQDPACDPPWPG